MPSAVCKVKSTKKSLFFENFDIFFKKPVEMPYFPCYNIISIKKEGNEHEHH